MFTKAVRTTACDWSVSDAVKTSQNNDLKISLLVLVLKWVKQSWAEIPAEMVRKSFKTCGISNALDGTEGDEVYAADMPELADDDMAMEDEFETDSEEDDE